MFRLWGKCIRNNHPVRDIVVCDGDYSKSRTRMVLDGLTGICRAFDLAEPIWLESNIEEFRRLSRTRFHQDSFIETLDFDYLEIRVIEE
ncbi:MAG: hypothetical protein J6P32_04540 [Stomatobaculum sp.]|nr:hypothetical protein [Stomatobaculum sp.]